MEEEGGWRRDGREQVWIRRPQGPKRFLCRSWNHAASFALNSNVQLLPWSGGYLGRLGSVPAV